MNTLLWTFETVGSSVNVVGSSLYDAVWSLSSWENSDSFQEVHQIKITDPKSGDFKMINKTLQPEILKTVNKTLKMSKNDNRKLVGLSNYKGMSCYMDSVLVPVLIVDSSLQNQLLTSPSEEDCGKDVQESLINLKKLIESDEKQKTCSTLFKELKKCYQFATLTTGEQQDDHDFFILLLQLFNIEPTLVREQLYVHENEKWKLKNDREENFGIIEINLLGYPENESILEYYQQGTFSDFSNVPDKEKPTGIDDKTPVNYTYTSNRILDSEFLIFHTARKLPGIKLNTSVGIPEIIKNIENDREYYLSIITVHVGGAFGGHYVSFFKLESQWYFYDDLKSRIRPIKLEDHKDIISKNSSLIFYF